MNKYILLLVTSLLSLKAFSQPGREDITTAGPPVTKYYRDAKIHERYVFLSFNSKAREEKFPGNKSPVNLSKVELAQIEKLIHDRVTIYNKTTKGRRIKFPEKYFKQFIAVINPEGEKIVWVNCMCEVVGNNWKKGIDFTLDGGSCYFHLKVNLTQSTVGDFSTNGLA